MADREKLIALMEEAYYCSIEELADHLIAHGVVVREKGEWMDNVDETGLLRNAWRKCSACGGLNFSKRPPLCPNCGADMRKGRTDEET